MFKIFLIIFYIISPIFSFAKESKFHKDSLSTKSTINKSNLVKKIPVEIIKGIVASDFKKLGWNEYVPKDAMEFQVIPLPTMRHHPRLITEFQIEQAKQNIKNFPYNNWFNQVYKSQFNLRSILFNPVNKVADRIKMIAFLYKIEGDRKYLIQVEDLLLRLPDPPLINNLQGGIVGKGWGDYLESAQAIVSFCVALDLVWNDINEDIRESTLQKMFVRTDQILNSFAYTPANNHLMVMGIALMEMAMLIDQTEKYVAYTRNQIWNIGWGHISRAAAIIAPDGGYAEGVDYGRFILSYLAPFSIHLYNITGIKLFENPQLIRMLNWVMANHKGNGIYSKFDDALNNSTFIFPLVISYSSHGALYNKFFKTLPQRNWFSANMVEGICVYRDIPSSFINEPVNIQFYPEMGQAVFKDKFFNPDIFVSVLGERERWFADRHEHIDPLAVELTAFGDDILIDPGYGQWTGDYNRTSWYTIPYAHNGILVDGLGTYRNPIWGDSSGCSMKDAFRTPAIASATFTTQIQDVDLARKAYFFTDKYLFLVDKIRGNSEHSIALNFNYLGNLVQKSDEIMHINNINSKLDILYSSTQKNPALISRNFGLQTPPAPAEEMASFKIEQLQMKDGYFGTLMIPSKSNTGNLQINKIPFKGKGTVNRVSNIIDTFSEMEFAVNRGNIIETSQWKSDSRIIFLSTRGSDLQSFLLVEFTYFEFGNIIIKSSVPVTLYLEKNKFQWLGYIESSDFEITTKLNIEGIPIEPFRFNHQIISPDKLIQNGINNYNIFLEGSGSLELGIGNQQVKMPYRYFAQSNFLSWIKRKFDLGLNYNNLSDYDKQKLKNHIVGNLYNGLINSAENLSQDIFNNPFIFNHIANASGLMQETISDMTFSTFDIPHRYAFEGQWGESKWKILEDGMFTEKGMRVRNLSLQNFNNNGRGLHYQYFNFFPEHQSHAVRLHSNRQNYLHYQFAETNKSKSQKIQAQYNNGELLLSPGYLWDKVLNNELVFINGRWKNYSGYLNRSIINGEKTVNGSIDGNINNLAFTFEGEQTSIKDSYFESISLFASPNFYLNQSMNIFNNNNGKWNLESFTMDFNYKGNNQTLRGRYFSNQNKSYQRIFYYLSSSKYYVSSHLDLNNFKFGKENQFQITNGFQFKNDYRYYSNISYQYDNHDSENKTLIYQQFWIPFGDYAYLHPVTEVQLPDDDPYKWIGSGFTYIGRIPFFGQILYSDQDLISLMDYQFSISNIKVFPNSEMMIWLHVQQNENEIQNTEIRIQNTTSVWQPGLYYLYNRDFGSRWEGYLEWNW